MKKLTQQFKTTILLTVFILLAITIKAQTGNYFVKHDGTVVQMHGDKARFTGYIYYTDENGNPEKIYQDEVKLLVFGKAVFYSRKEGGPLYRIVAFNDNYIIGGTLKSQVMFYWVFERKDFNTVTKNGLALYGSRPKASIKLKKLYDENFGVYFKNCNELNEACYKNINEIQNAFIDIDYYNCGSSIDLITGNPVDKNVKTQPVMEQEPVYFYVNTSGEKIIIENNTKGEQDLKNNRIASLNPNFKYNIGLSYFNGRPIYKSKTVPSKSVKYIYLSDNIYAPLTIKSEERIVKIICFNNDFVLFPEKKGWVIYDRNISAIIEKMDDKISPLLDKYFNDCPDLRKLVDENIKYHRSSTSGITYYNCNNSKELIEGIELE